MRGITESIRERSHLRAASAPTRPGTSQTSLSTSKYTPTRSDFHVPTARTSQTEMTGSCITFRGIIRNQCEDQPPHHHAQATEERNFFYKYIHMIRLVKVKCIVLYLYNVKITSYSGDMLNCKHAKNKAGQLRKLLHIFQFHDS